MKSVQLKQIGWLIKGTAIINYWGGGQGVVTMQPQKIIGSILTKEYLLGAVNDGGFGCISIESAEIDVYELYENNYTVLRSVINAGKDYSHLFNAWQKFQYRD
jgi:hypothetical protein